jgi:SAM-dependent methyltransferase
MIEQIEKILPIEDEIQIKGIMSRIISAYGSFIVRTYCQIRFIILRERFTKEMVQYLPDGSRVIELGCGFGLFTLLFAYMRPRSTFFAFDYNQRRIDLAREAACRLGLSNIEFHCEDAANFKIEQTYQAGYVMDLIHHVGKDRAKQLLTKIYSCLDDDSIFLIKEVDNRPAFKMWFTRILDFVMAPRDEVYYWPETQMKTMLRQIGWEVTSHAMVDFLPYPHRIYICHKTKVKTSEIRSIIK